MEREKREIQERENFEFILMYFVQLIVNIRKFHGGLEEEKKKRRKLTSKSTE